MSQRKTPLVAGEFYHIYNRGNARQTIFFCDEDYERFVKLLYLCNSTRKVNFRDDIVKKSIDAWDFERDEQLVSIGAWVLMPNHFHIYITANKSEALPLAEGGNAITIFLHKLGTAYSSYINAKYKRTGALFEGKFKSIHVSDDVQAKYLFSYIHLNPIKLILPNWKDEGVVNPERATEFLEKYRWSSYIDYISKARREIKLLQRENFPEYFSDENSIKTEIYEWITLPEARPLDTV